MSVVVCLFVAVCLFACCCLVVGMFVVVCLILAAHEWKCGCRCDSTCRRTKIKRIIAYPFVRFSVSLPARPPALCLRTLMVQKPSSGNPVMHRIMLRQLCIKGLLIMRVMLNSIMHGSSSTTTAAVAVAVAALELLDPNTAAHPKPSAPKLIKCRLAHTQAGALG